MACGLPVVTTACGTNHEAVPPPNARTEDDAEALAAALVPLLADPGLRREVGAFNRAYVEERTMSSCRHAAWARRSTAPSSVCGA